MAEPTEPLIPRPLDLKTMLLGAVALGGTLVGFLDPIHTFSDGRTNEHQWELLGKHTEEIASLKASSERYREQIRENRDEQIREIRELRRELEAIKGGDYGIYQRNQRARPRE